MHDDTSKTEVWIEDECEDEPVEETQDLLSPTINEGYVKFLFFWQYAYRVSDVGLSLLLTLVAKFLVVIWFVLSLKPLEDFARQLPTTAAGARALLGKRTDIFNKFSCCPSCSALYPVD